MFADLNVPVPTLTKQQLSQAASKKGKGKQEQSGPAPAFTPAQVASIESRIDLLVHCQCLESLWWLEVSSRLC